MLGTVIKSMIYMLADESGFRCTFWLRQILTNNKEIVQVFLFIATQQCLLEQVPIFQKNGCIAAQLGTNDLKRKKIAFLPNYLRLK